MGRVDFYSIKSCFLRPGRGRSEIRHHFPDILPCHGNGSSGEFGHFHSADPQSRPACNFGICHPACVVNLRNDFGSVFMDRISQTAQPFHGAVVGDGQLSLGGFALNAHIAVFGNYQPDIPAGSLFPIVITELRCDFPVFAGFGGCHGRHDQAVFQVQISYFDRCIQQMHRDPSFLSFDILIVP